MKIQPNLINYYKSLADEFSANKNQIRDLIGSTHWPSEGGHKEAILRRVLQNKLPEIFRVGTGFFTDGENTSTQIDILIADASKPTLFQNGDFLVVTPDCVKGIIEVKTSLIGRQKTNEAIGKLIKNVEKIRNYQIWQYAFNNPQFNYRNYQELEIIPFCWAGLFVYEDDNELKMNYLLEELNLQSENKIERTINCLTIGENLFIRFWPNVSETFKGRLRNPGWQSYKFRENHKKLSPAYFIGNLVMNLTNSENSYYSRAWFPIQTGNGKEDYGDNFFEMGANNINTHL